MEEKEKFIVNNCDFMSMQPAMMELPYPPIKVKEKNLNYANLLSIDYCGVISEMSAISQYINNENRLSYDNCPFAKIILSIAMAEMMHLQKLGELMVLLGGTVDFIARGPKGKQRMWSPTYLELPETAKRMIIANIEAEKATINQYRMHINIIDDKYVNAVLMRIIKDEEYHIMILQSMLEMLEYKGM